MATNLGNIPLDRRSCQLLGPTALIVQALMGLLAVLSLVYKRHRETQKRPWKIWLFDVLKQVFGAMFIHGLNVIISALGSYRFAGNACTYYFLNILIDTTLGVGLIYIVLQCATWVLSKQLGIKGLKTGQYGNPPSFTHWMRQAAVYIFALTVMKLVVVGLFAFWPGISTIGDWLLGWTTLWDGESVQVIFVMGVFPMIMNIVQFWLIDSIVKASTSSNAVRPVSPRDSDSQDREPLFSSPDDDDDALPRDIENFPPTSASRTMSEGDFKTLVGTEDDQTKLLTSGSSSPMSFSKNAVVVAHDHPPDSADSVSSQSSTRSRHKYKRASSSLLEVPMTYSAPAVNTLDSSRYPSRLAVFSRSLDAVEVTADDVAEFDAWEKRRDVSERWSNRRSVQNGTHINGR
ncbi:vacuolar membrane protein-domain-containing protein [Boletus edulis]|nr:vacuolar membrane protein-domain-containing protein [Boletus edulis]